GLDITVQDDHFVPALGNLLRGKHAGRSRAYHEDGLHLGSLQNRRATAQSRYFPLISSVLLLPVALLSLTIRTHACPSFIHFPAGGHVLLGLFKQLPPLGGAPQHGVTRLI